MTAPAEVARRVLEEATEHAAWTADWKADPVNGRAVRQLAKFNKLHGTVSVYDDPVLSVRCSDLIALCETVVGIQDLHDASVSEIDRVAALGQVASVSRAALASFLADLLERDT